MPTDPKALKTMRKRKAHPGYVDMGKKRVVKVKPHTYQPSKAELEADVSVAVTPEELAQATMRNVILRETDDP